MALAANGTVLRSGDGADWTMVNADMGTHNLASGIAYHDGAWIIAAQNRFYWPVGDGPAALFESVDQGATWVKRFQNVQFMGLVTCGSALFASDWDGGLKVRPSAAVGWLELPTSLPAPGAQVDHLVCADGALFRGSGKWTGNIFSSWGEVSLDGGLTWRNSSAPLGYFDNLAYEQGRWYRFNAIYQAFAVGPAR
jgi:hypothetical protein